MCSGRQAQLGWRFTDLAALPLLSCGHFINVKSKYNVVSLPWLKTESWLSMTAFSGQDGEELTSSTTHQEQGRSSSLGLDLVTNLLLFWKDHLGEVLMLDCLGELFFLKDKTSSAIKVSMPNDVSPALLHSSGLD